MENEEDQQNQQQQQNEQQENGQQQQQEQQIQQENQNQIQQNNNNNEEEEEEDEEQWVSDELDEEEDKQEEEEEQKDDGEEKYGCAHYQRKCKIQSPCCKKWFGCRLCHDNEYVGPKGPCPVEVMDRYNISKIQCLVCEAEQAPGKECQECTVEFARYYCEICKLWNDKPGAQIYHCDKCKMCRVGTQDTLFHCDKCNVCLPIVNKNNHKCISSMENQNCPICLDNLKISTIPWITIKCGHAIHQKCYNGYIKSRNYKCPLCQQSLFEMPKHEIQGYDKMVEECMKNIQHIPKEFKEEDGSLKKVDIICNQCSRKSLQIDLNPVGLKCQQKDCGSYLTDML